MVTDALFDRKVPVYLTREQLEWVNDRRFALRLENRSQVIRDLIDAERANANELPDRCAGEPPPIKPYTPADYPGQGFAPVLVPWLIANPSRYYSLDQLVRAVGMDPATIDTGKRASIGNTMRALGFAATNEITQSGAREHGWQFS